MKHATKGPHAEWEDVLVLVYGDKWRQFRDCCRDLGEWMAKSTSFLRTVCEQWGLPQFDRRAEPQEKPPACKKQRLHNHTLDSIPISHAGLQREQADYDWELCGRRFTFIVDCKPLQAVVCGHSLLEDDGLQPTMAQLLQNLGCILDEGWIPPRAWHDPVVWTRRERNQKADFLANLTMDRAATWATANDWPFEGWSLNECNLVAHTDGGTRRAKNCSASAWIVEVGRLTKDGWEYKNLAIGGTYFEKAISSFSAEALALLECSVFIRRLVAKYSIYTPLGKSFKLA